MKKTINVNTNGSDNFHSPMRIRAGVLAGPVHSFSTERNRHFSPCLDLVSEITISEEFIDFDLYLETLEQLEKASYDGDFLLRTGLGQSVGDLGLFGKAVLTSETLWDSLQIVRKGLNYLMNTANLSITIRFGRCRLEYDLNLPRSFQGDLEIQYSVALLTNVVSQAVWTPTANMRIGFPSARSEHKHLFPFAEVVHQCRTGVIEFDDILLRSPMKSSDAGVYATLRPLMEGVDVGFKEPSDYGHLIQQLLLNSIEHAHAPLKLSQAASLLGISSRTLQEKLKLEGTSFSGLRSQSRHGIAKKALAKGYSIEEVSAKVGYSHRQTFSEAFTALEGVSPSVFASRGRRA
ncbi:helix-turn-helix domain-containing protein [Ruegeria sp. HKCCD4884]|uniref:helix-turn-helix transcriptional regulator n=1 Tax=Ruegeria sp. HKCCD4884 TaxID=2683022 RepID=UPI001492DFF9|nr:helix-turn-helix domain-containing protein [Ruegeria sp. HKCCD4884]NOD95364.1 helix-turn-helix domain-containing protein [Ruegeria sp. HKCCD4884]